MKYYIKDGIIKIANDIIVISKGIQTINPSEEKILADGWKEYIPTLDNEEPDKNSIFKAETESKVMEMVYKANVSSMINTFELTNKEALAVKDMYPEWKEDLGEVKKGERYQYGDLLWEVVQSHTTQELWKPSLATASLWKMVDEEHAGTQEDPIPYNPPMEIFKDKYYTQNEVLYKCTRNSGIPLSHDLSALIGTYVELV